MTERLERARGRTWRIGMLTSLWITFWMACGSQRADTMYSTTLFDCDALKECPSFDDVPCHAAPLDFQASYVFCDDCGRVWFCYAANDRSAAQMQLYYSDYPCACITSDFQLDTADRSCGDTAR